MPYGDKSIIGEYGYGSGGFPGDGSSEHDGFGYSNSDGSGENGYEPGAYSNNGGGTEDGRGKGCGDFNALRKE